MKPNLIGAVAVLAAVACSHKDTINPGVWDSYRNPVEQSEVRDPSVFEQDGKFYLFSSGSDESILPVMVSEKLTSWSPIANVFNQDNAPQFIKGTYPQCPEIAKVGQNYLLYYSLNKSADLSGIGVAVADLVTGPYTDHGEILRSETDGVKSVVSPSFFDDGDSKYLVFGSFKGIFLVRLSDDGLSVAPGESPVKIASDIFDAPYLMKRDGLYYLFASVGKADGDASSKCMQAVGRAETVSGPYLDKNSLPMTQDGYEILVKGSSKFAGPGHGVVLSVGHDETWILYNAYDLSDASKGRTLMLDHVSWNNGWPSVRGAISSFCADSPDLNLN